MLTIWSNQTTKEFIAYIAHNIMLKSNTVYTEIVNCPICHIFEVDLPPVEVRAIPFEILRGGRNGKFRGPPPPHIFFFSIPPPPLRILNGLALNAL